MRTLDRTARHDRVARPGTTDPPTRFFLLAMAALLVLHALLAWLGRPRGLGTIQDDAIYLLLARSLRAFGYHDLYILGAPVHHLYPPGYPGALALVSSLAGERLVVLQGFGIAASVAALGLFAATVRRLWSTSVAVLVLAAVVINPHLVGAAGKIGADATYLLLSIIALTLLARHGPSPRMLAVAGAAAIAAALTRSIGITLLAGVGAFWLLERRLMATGLFAAASAATVGLWTIWTVVAPEQYVGRSYIADATFARDEAASSTFASVLADRVLTNLPAYFGQHIPNRIGIPPLPGPASIDLLAAVLASLALLAGMIVLWRRWPPVALYLIFFGALLTVWPWSIGRFLNVVIPLLVLGVLLGARLLTERVWPGGGRAALVAGSLALVVMGAVRSAKVIHERSSCQIESALPSAECGGAEQTAFFLALDHLNANAPPDAVLVSGKPAPAYFFTGRPTLPFGRVLSQPEDRVLEMLREHGARWIVLSRLHPAEHTTLARLLAPSCASLVLEAGFEPSTLVLRVLDADMVAPSGGACRALAEYRRLPLRAVPEGG
jgi:hypothetical protein